MLGYVSEIALENNVGVDEWELITVKYYVLSLPFNNGWNTDSSTLLDESPILKSNYSSLYFVIRKHSA